MGKIDVFMKYQQTWLRDHSLIKIWEKSRRIGATWTQAYEDVEDAVLQREYTPGRPVKKIYFSSKDEDAGKEYIEYCLMWSKVFNVLITDMGEMVIEEDDTHKVKARVLEFKNGSKIISLSSAPTAFNSKGGKIVWDEAALHKDQRSMWSGAQPAAVVWGYPIRILSTHKGKATLFFRFCKRAKEGKNGFSHHKVTIVDAVNDGLYDKRMLRATTKDERDAFVASIKQSCDSDDIFNEDYMADPVDATTSYFPYDLISLCEYPDILKNFLYLKNCNNTLYAGWDIGRKKDLSVVTVGENVAPNLYVRKIQEFNRTKFKVQYMFFKAVMQLPNMMRCCIDATGMGLPIAEAGQDEFGATRVESITFTGASKEILAVGAKQLFEDRKVLIPDYDTLRESIHSIKRMVTTVGNIRFDADRTDETGHADHFWSLALMIHAKTGGPSGPTWATSSGDVTNYNKYAEDIDYATYR